MQEIFTIITPFEILQSQEEEFRQQWHANTESSQRAPGFLSSRLYETSPEVLAYVQSHLTNMKWLEPRFRFVTISEWASVEQYEAAMGAIGQPATSFTSYPASYYSVSNPDRTTSSFGTQDSRDEQAFTFIVPFEVPEGQEEEMRRQFQAIVEDFGERVGGAFGPGLFEIDPHTQEKIAGRQAGETETHPPFRFFNIARWASVEHYKAAMESRKNIKPITFPGHGMYYRLSAQSIA